MYIATRPLLLRAAQRSLNWADSALLLPLYTFPGGREAHSYLLIVHLMDTRGLIARRHNIASRASVESSKSPQRCNHPLELEPRYQTRDIVRFRKQLQIHWSNRSRRTLSRHIRLSTRRGLVRKKVGIDLEVSTYPLCKLLRGI